MSTLDHHNGDGFEPTHTGLNFLPDGIAPNVAAPNLRRQQDLRPLSSAETLAARPSTSHELSESSLPKEKRESFNGENGDRDASDDNTDRDLEKQEDKEPPKDDKSEEEKDPNLIEWDGDDDKVYAI